MNKAIEKAKREQEFEYKVSGAVITVKERKGGAVVTVWDMAALPTPIQGRLMAQGGSTILQQRKSGKNGLEAIRIMDAHYNNWMTGAFEMERKQALTLPGWVFPALCLKMPQVAPAKILASLEAKREGATIPEWQAFLTALTPYREQLAASAEGQELISLD